MAKLVVVFTIDDLLLMIGARVLGLIRLKSGFIGNLPLLFSLLFFAACSGTKLVKTETNNLPITVADSLEGDKAIKEIVAPYRAKLEAEMNEILASSAQPMEKAQPEGLLGNFVADLAYERALAKYKPADGKQADLVLLNNGGLRVPLPEGEITKGKIFELMPFENELVVITLSGVKTKELVEYIAAIGGQPVANIKMGIQNGKPYGVYIGKDAFDESKTYKVITSDYLANGGDNMGFFLEPLARENIAYKLRDAIIDYLRAVNASGDKINSKLDGRIYELKP